MPELTLTEGEAYIATRIRNFFVKVFTTDSNMSKQDILQIGAVYAKASDFYPITTPFRVRVITLIMYQEVIEKVTGKKTLKKYVNECESMLDRYQLIGDDAWGTTSPQYLPKAWNRIWAMSPPEIMDYLNHTPTMFTSLKMIDRLPVLDWDKVDQNTRGPNILTEDEVADEIQEKQLEELEVDQLKADDELIKKLKNEQSERETKRLEESPTEEMGIGDTDLDPGDGLPEAESEIPD